MVSLFPIENKIDKMKVEFMDWLRDYVTNSLRPQLLKEISKELGKDELMQVERMEKLQPSKENALFFLKCIRAIEAIEKIQNPKPKIQKIAKEFGLSESEVRVLVDIVRYHRLYQKFMASKEDILRLI